jgi:hypothetical protein
MSSVDVLSWETDYPWYYKVFIEKPYGKVDFVDEYGTPFWSKANHVLLKPTHPIFTAKELRGALKDVHLAYSNQLELVGHNDELKKQPIRVSKEVYQAAKLIFHT